MKTEAEEEANMIANILLMPEHKVRYLLENGMTIEEMADKFFVDVVHMTLRVKELYPNLLVI